MLYANKKLGRSSKGGCFTFLLTCLKTLAVLSNMRKVGQRIRQNTGEILNTFGHITGLHI